MGTRKTFTEIEMRQLEKNPNVQRITKKAITYKPEFKVKAVKENLNGKPPMTVFIENGFDLTTIGRDKPKQCLKRWRKVFHKEGKVGLLKERRGLESMGRPADHIRSAEEELQKAKGKIAFLEAELDFLKKLDELERRGSKR